MRRFSLYILLFIFFSSFIAFADEEPERDYLYSEEYFEYLIECANEETIEQKEKEQEELESETVQNDNQITAFEFDEEISEVYEPFKLRIESNSSINPYGETFKKENSKTIIPVGNKFAFTQDTLVFRNKYNSDDYRVLAGAEVYVNKYLTLVSGLETNYRGFDQNPTSKKLHFTPTLYINDKLQLKFHNKLNTQTKSSDHDLELKISPFKSKVMDFTVYAGLTNKETGKHSESVNVRTNFYFF